MQHCLIFYKNMAFLSQLLLDRLLVAAGLVGSLVREEYMQGFLKGKRGHVYFMKFKNSGGENRVK